MFTGEVYGLGLWPKFTGRVYGSSLLVQFRFHFLSRVYGSILRIVFYRWNRLVKFTGRH